ncbi:MAG: amino acid permease [Sporichthyaceae bacterium]
MTAIATPPATPPPSDVADAGDLSTFGYQQQLHRSIGSYGSFAAGFSFVSILTTVFQLFAFGFAFGGPAFFWTWPIVFVGQLMVALCFAELAARYPISGCIYQWASRLGGKIWGWAAGWLMLVAQTVTVAAAAIALQIVLPAIWSGFAILDNPTHNAVLLGSALLIVTTAINAAGVGLMSRINSIGVTVEIVGVILLCIALFAVAERGPDAVLQRPEGSPGGTAYFSAFVISGLMAAYVMVGFDSAGELSEETKNPRYTAPRTILRALIASAVGGAFMLLATMMAAPSLGDGTLGDPAAGLPYVLTERLGSVLGRVFLCAVVVAVCVCTLAIQTAGSRMVFSMARDRVLPLSGPLSKVNARTGTPILPAVVIGVVAAAVLLVNVGNSLLFLALASVCIMLLYIAYLMVTIPQLNRRLAGAFRDTEGPEGEKLFGLGRWGVAVNVAAVFWGVAMAINLGWPRTEVFGEPWYLHWFPQIFLAGTAFVGFLAWLSLQDEPIFGKKKPVAPHIVALAAATTAAGAE